MRFPLLSLLLVGALAAPAAAQTVSIDFEFYPGPDNILGTGDDVPIVAPTLFSGQTLQLTNEFTAVGVDFTPNPAVNDKNEILDAATFSTPAGHTPPNILASSGTATITGSFNVPVSSVSALIGISGGADELRIYDAGGALLGSMVGDDAVVTLSSSTNIASFEVVPVASTTPAIDNLTFDVSPSGPVLTSSGAPGGTMNFVFANFTPGGTIAVVYGPAGTLNVTSGPCAGVTLGLIPQNFPPSSALVLLAADGSGGALLSRTVPAGAAGLSVQAADVASCGLSNVIVL